MQLNPLVPLRLKTKPCSRKTYTEAPARRCSGAALRARAISVSCGNSSGRACACMHRPDHARIVIILRIILASLGHRWSHAESLFPGSSEVARTVEPGALCYGLQSHIRIVEHDSGGFQANLLSEFSDRQSGRDAEGPRHGAGTHAGDPCEAGQR